MSFLLSKVYLSLLSYNSVKNINEFKFNIINVYIIEHSLVTFLILYIFFFILIQFFINV
jgi:hypothetical protein